MGDHPSKRIINELFDRLAEYARLEEPMSIPRPFTTAERQEVRDLCYRGRLGRLREDDNKRATALYNINMDEYAEIGKSARAEADATVNPLAPDHEGS